MQELQFQVSKINAKYAKHEDNKAMKRRKQMEVMALYRKNGVNPLGSIGSIFITMPVFLSI
jgi:YidC/Oxa1 family membrane protein insertase